MKKRMLITVTVIALLVACFAFLASNPIISQKSQIPEDFLEAIKSQSRGLYSTTLPLVPVFVSVENFSSDSVYYTIHYFPFGTVGMSYTEEEGYNIEKPLTNQ